MTTTEDYTEYLDHLEDYLDHVNTDVSNRMQWETELYASYGSRNNLVVEEVKYWYEKAENAFIGVHDPFDYIRAQTDQHTWDDELWDLIEREIDDGIIYVSGEYWFLSE